MTIPEKLQALRQIMALNQWDAAVISGTDPHASEYLPEHWQQRKWISGFTGSYGTVVVTASDAGLWTDTRYFIQATKELEGSGIALHKLRVPDAVNYPEWLDQVLPEKSTVVVDGTCMNVSDVQQLKLVMAIKNGKVENAPRFLYHLWQDAPALPLNPLFVLPSEYTGRTTEEKVARLRQQMEEECCTHLLINALDQIAWLLNIRCHDVPFNPVAIAYLLVSKDNVQLFLTLTKVGQSVKHILEGQGITLMPYDTLEMVLDHLPKESVIWLDCNTINYHLYEKLTNKEGNGELEVCIGTPPITLDKAIKNPVEIEGFRRAYIQDGIALTRFFKWLEERMKAGVPTSELDAAAHLSSLRAQGEDAMGDSFHTISAYGANAALPHYSASPKEFSYLQPKGLYLVDSGGHYLFGTTDITRTIPLGPLTPMEREDYTLVLKGMIALSTAVFMKGTTGTHLDMLVREPLWKYARNYGHGTGHGIGHYLCVHEGPQDIRMTWRDQPICPGMITSNEPGMYRQGLHGVRHENVLLCKPLCQNEFGEFLHFETLTLCYIDPSPLLPELLTEEEQQWISQYNHHVHRTLAPYLSSDELNWLLSKV